METLSDEELIIKNYGLEHAERTERFLVEEVKDTELLEPIHYILTARQDCLHPSIISLSCEAAHGDPVGVQYVSMAVSLACHSIAIFDDLLDRTTTRRFVPTVLGRFGFDRALLVGGFVAAKAFGALDLLAENVSTNIFIEVSREFQKFLSKMTFAEITNSNLSKTSTFNAQARLDLLEAEGSDIEASGRLGTIVGGCGAREVEMMTEYGHHLGKALRLREDLESSLNLTLELDEKIRRGAIPYPTALALTKMDRREQLMRLFNEKTGTEDERVHQLVCQLFDTGAFDHTIELIEKETRDSVNALKEIGECEAKHALTVMASSQKKLALRNLKPLL